MNANAMFTGEGKESEDVSCDDEGNPYEGDPSVILHNIETAAAATVTIANCEGEESRKESRKESRNKSLTTGCENTFAWRQHLQGTLYDRRGEVVLLQRAFQRGLQEQPHATKNATFVLITGPSGTGKTRLARTLRDQVEDQGGYFLTGKFAQSNRCPAPYAAFCEALTEFAGLVHQRGEAAAVRHKIHAAVGQEIGILTRMIPGLARIVGNSHASSQVAADTTQATAGDALSQFVFVFRMFLRAVCSPAQPMVLLLDDLQWADPCSLDLLMSVVTDTANDGLVLIATCRDHVSPTAYLSHKLREIKDKVHVVLTTIALRNLSPTVVTQVIADALALDAENSAALGTIVSRQTQGNLFYMIEFLRWLHKADLLYYDGSMDSWTFDPDEIHIHIPQTINMCHADAFLLDRMEQLPREVKEVLKVAACLGTQVELSHDSCLGQRTTGPSFGGYR
jgi:predicted ATPase